MKTYIFRVVVDTEKDIFRDINILENQTFEDLHKSIIKAFEFKGDQMASFYISNEKWEKGEEIALMDMSLENESGPINMNNTIVSSKINSSNQKILYIYDFLKMWIFYIELVKEGVKEENVSYPYVSLVFGSPPNELSKDINYLFDSDFDDINEKNKTSNDLDEDEFENFDNIEDYDF